MAKAHVDYSRSEGLDHIFQAAIDKGATDIHLDPEEEGVTVRYRIDGSLYAVESISQEDQDEYVARIKVLAGIDTTQYRIPADGQFEFEHEDKKYSFRISTFPSTKGEAIVFRILNRENVLRPLHDLGLTDGQLDEMTTLIHQPYGIILITGPSNSGKTTVLYSVLNLLNSDQNNIISTEDPVELDLKGVRQMQVNEEIGLTFGRSMKAILRQDPDIIMLGEIRDTDALDMATQAALSGRLVLATFHTFDVPALVIRLTEMGIPLSVIGHAFRGIVSRRLIRTICSSCTASHTPTDEEKLYAGEGFSFDNLKQGTGCNECHSSGYSGRTGVFEIVTFDDEIKACILGKRISSELGQIIESKKSATLKEAGLQKVAEGITTIEEIMRVVGVGG